MINPSIIRKITITASFIGLIDSVYLAVLKLTQNQAMCIKGVGDCWAVNNSRYASVFGIPVSILGAIVYLVLIGVTLGENRHNLLQTFGPKIAFGLALSGFLYSIYLTYLEIAVIKAVCPFCIISAICMSVIFASTLLSLIRNQSDYKLFLEEKNG